MTLTYPPSKNGVPVEKGRPRQEEEKTLPVDGHVAKASGEDTNILTVRAVRYRVFSEFDRNHNYTVSLEGVHTMGLHTVTVVISLFIESSQPYCEVRVQ